MSYGFIITRHVNSESTNRYWNHCIKCIRRFYPHRKIVVIDDNSNQEFVKADFDYMNVEYIQSEYPGRGELLPFIYFLRRRFFEKAVILHDSVFIHKRIAFGKLAIPVMPLWHFDSNHDPHVDNKRNNARIAGYLTNSSDIVRKLLPGGGNPDTVMMTKMDWKTTNKWNGCFGVQCFISWGFVKHLEDKYRITNMLNGVVCRTDRCSLERVMGILFNVECPETLRIGSLLGDIMKYMPHGYGYTYDEYMNLLREKKVLRPVIKVWTGR